MAEINRSNSPMNLYRDDYLETKEDLDDARNKLIEEQSIKAPFVIGSIETVNDRIANLDRELNSFTSALVIESPSSNLDGDDYPPLVSEENPIKARDVKELNQFAGVYSVKSTLMASKQSKPNIFTKKIKTAQGKKKQQQEKSATKPKLVELFQYRGYDSKRLTPLPEVDSALTILQRVTDAQKDLTRKPQYKQEFKRLFYSRMSEAVLVDTFWWFFLNRYHPSKIVQPQLFNRVAHNYVKLLLFAKHPKYRDVFFHNYADLLAQGLYAAFCAAFPDSWRQFDDQFCGDICDLTSLWVVGTKPAPLSWSKWDMEVLEPKDLRKEVILKKESKKGTFLNFDVSLSETSPGHQGSSIATSPPPTEFEFTEKSPRKQSIKSGSNASAVSAANEAVPHQDSDNFSIDSVAQAQTTDLQTKTCAVSKASNKKKGNMPLQPITETDKEYSLSLASEKIGEGKLIGKKNSKTIGNMPSRTNVHKQPSLNGVNPRLSDTNMGKSSVTGVDSHGSVSKKHSSHVTVHDLPGRRKHESHPATKGPSFNKVVFNTGGQSPLVSHFMRQKGLNKKAGIDVYLQRTEIDSLPPSDALTYNDIIHEAFQSIRNLDAQFQEMFEMGAQEHSIFIKKQRQQLKEHMRREEALMSQPKEVKRLSDLLVLELLKDPDEVNTGAALAVEEALLHQDEQDS